MLSVLISSCNFDVEKNSVFMYAMNIQNDAIGLLQHENCKSKQMIDFIAWPSRCHDTIFTYYMHLSQVEVHLYSLPPFHFMSTPMQLLNNNIFWELKIIHSPKTWYHTCNHSKKKMKYASKCTVGQILSFQNTFPTLVLVVR